ncbi:hypothetical protein sos41_30120 [Alphaproteobacteria bacterium SO-S41]|nr:hypothetical protein sos41_30120 [Alphaproteobacteria bacterium SO-S41]
MITALLIVTLLMTLLLGLSLPWTGWGSGMDAAGRGMAMFFPFLFMLVRVVCVFIALIVLVWGGGLDWTGLPKIASGLLAIVLVGGMSLMSFWAINMFGSSPSRSGRAQLAFMTTIAAPLALVIWIFAERYGATDPAQAWPVRGLVLMLALVPIPMLVRLERREAADRRVADAAEAAAIAAAEARAAAAVPAGATLADIFRAFDGMAETEWRTRGFIMDRATALPDPQTQMVALLTDPVWENRVAAGLHAEFLQPQPADYFEKVRPIIEEVVRRLQSDAAPPEVLVRETKAALRLAWPAIHNTGLPQALVAALYGEALKRADDTHFRNLEHDLKLLAELVRG